MNEYSPVGDRETAGALADGGAATQPDLLTAIEQRWDKLANSVRALRDENAALWEQLQGHEDNVSRMQQELAAKTAEVAALIEEKKRTEGRIEGLLARFDASGQ